MGDTYFRSGLAAKQLGISSYNLRLLCEAGLIQAEITRGRHWRIPATELERLKREGVPAVPQKLPDEPPNGTRTSSLSLSRTGHLRREPQDLYAPPSEEVIRSAEEVTITENRVRKRQIEFEAEEVEDWFVEREQRQAAEAAADRQATIEAALRERRENWEGDWMTHALSSVPKDAPSPIKIDVYDRVQEVLKKLQPNRPDTVVQQIVHAAVESGLAPWRYQKAMAKLIDRAVDRLPARAKSPWKPSEWQIRAKEAAHQAVRQLEGDTSLAEVEAAAARSVDRIKQEFEHRLLCSSIVQSVGTCLSGETAQEREAAKEVVAQAVATAPTSATERELERIRDEALRPLKDRIFRRRDQTNRESWIRLTVLMFPWDMEDHLKEEALKAVRAQIEALPAGTDEREIRRVRDTTVETFRRASEIQKKKHKLIDEGLCEIPLHLERLLRDWEFDDTPSNLARELILAVREQLQRELSGEEPLDQVTKRVRRLVDDELGIRG